MPLNLEKYRPYFEEFDMTDEQRDEFIETLWLIVNSFADQSFGLTSSQQICEYKPDKVCPVESTLVESGYQPKITGQVANDNELLTEIPTPKARASYE